MACSNLLAIQFTKLIWKKKKVKGANISRIPSLCITYSYFACCNLTECWFQFTVSINLLLWFGLTDWCNCSNCSHSYEMIMYLNSRNWGHIDRVYLQVRWWNAPALGSFQGNLKGESVVAAILAITCKCVIVPPDFFVTKPT